MFLLYPAPEITAMQHSLTVVIIYRKIQCISVSIDDAASVPVGLSVSVCDFGTLVVEGRVKNGADRSVSLILHPPAFLASTRSEGKTVSGFWGFLESGSH